MATRSGGGDSKQGLIITLVIFILLTLILGVTTYLGFSVQTQLEKARDDAGKEKTEWQHDADWYQFHALAYRSYMGLPLSAKEKETYDLRRGSFDSSG